MARRTSFTCVVLLALSSVWSCNGVLDNEPRYLDPGLGQGGNEGSGTEASGAAGQAATSGGDAADAGAPAMAAEGGGGAVGAGGAPLSPGATAGAGETSATAGAPPASCPTTADCALAVCDGKSCGGHGLKCIEKKCACPGGATSETSCSDGVDNNCDGVVDCADKTCDHVQCGSVATSRCCSGSCVDTGSDANNCQACGTKCASGKSCRLLNDGDGRRGHCECAGTSSLCPGYPAVVCRNETPNANVCAQTEASACPTGQTFVDVTGGP